MTRRSLRRRVPAWAVAGASALLGLAAAGLVALALKRVGPPSRDANLGDTHLSIILVPGPFRTARSAFAAVIASAGMPVPTTPAASAQVPATIDASRLPKAAPSTSPRVSAQSSYGVPTGTLKVICFPGCDQVIDNGNALGPSPIIRRGASVGSHRVRLVWGDSSKIVSTVVLADQIATVREAHP